MGKRTLRTRLCDMLDIEYPILSAGMGPALIGEETGAPVELVVAVSEAGGCGVLGTSGYSVDELRGHIRDIKSKTDKPYGVDLLFPKNLMGLSAGEKPSSQDLSVKNVLKFFPKEYQVWLDKVREELDLPDVDISISADNVVTKPKEAVQVCLDEKVPLICAGLGDPGFMVEDAHAIGSTVLAITGNVKNAKRMVESGIDILVAQGHEGGGHTGRVGTMALLPQAIDVAGSVPVLAAGGIGDGRGLAASLAMGCAGVWVGTRFLASEEGGANATIKKAIVESNDESTRVSTAITGKTSRTIHSRYHELWNESGLDPLPFPVQMLLTSLILAALMKSGKPEYLGGFAGQIAGLIGEIKPARQVLEDMVEEAADILTVKLPQDVVVS